MVITFILRLLMKVLLLPLWSVALAINYPLPEDAPNHKSRLPCDDGFYIVNAKELVSAEDARVICPSGYQLANLSSQIKMRRAASTLFRCRGPSSEAWIGGGIKGNEKVSGLMSLVAPSAIEKSLSVKVSPGRIDFSMSDKLLPAICEPN